MPGDASSGSDMPGMVYNFLKVVEERMVAQRVWRETNQKRNSEEKAEIFYIKVWRDAKGHLADL